MSDTRDEVFKAYNDSPARDWNDFCWGWDSAIAAFELAIAIPQAEARAVQAERERITKRLKAQMVECRERSGNHYDDGWNIALDEAISIINAGEGTE